MGSIVHSIVIFGYWMSRFNDRLVRELALEEGEADYRTRTGRLDKWKQVTKESAPSCVVAPSSDAACPLLLVANIVCQPCKNHSVRKHGRSTVHLLPNRNSMYVRQKGRRNKKGRNLWKSLRVIGSCKRSWSNRLTLQKDKRSQTGKKHPLVSPSVVLFWFEVPKMY